MNFLTHLPQDWNISLFHYRNHGAAFGRVLVGMQVPNGDRSHVEEYFDEIGYRYWKESDNAPIGCSWPERQGRWSAVTYGKGTESAWVSLCNRRFQGGCHQRVTGPIVGAVVAGPRLPSTQPWRIVQGAGNEA
jgi:hypothetical protein